MKYTHPLRFLAASALVLVAACSYTDTTVVPLDAAARDKDNTGEDCVIVFVEEKDLPEQALAVGSIESHIQRHIFSTGVADNEGDMRPELIEKACSIGATHVVVDDFIETRATEFSHVHAWARAFRIER